jgi:type IV secretion system protein VirB3
MSDPDPRLAVENTLYVACTRPAMMYGVQAEAFMLNVSGSIILGGWIGLGSWHKLIYWPLLIGVTHLIQRYAYSQDHNWFRVLKVMIETKGRGTPGWGGSSVTPIPAAWPRKSKELSIGL